MRFVAYSKFDGKPLPARNPQELAVLLQQGHHAEPRTELRGEPGPELSLPAVKEVPDAEPSGADVPDPAGDADAERVRDEERDEDVADDGPGASVPPAARKRN